jgi:hypothetical protein
MLRNTDGRPKLPGGNNIDMYTEKGKKVIGRIGAGASDAEGELLYNLAKNLPEAQVIVQIGKGTGESIVWLAKGSMEGNLNKIYSIRPGSGEFTDIEPDQDGRDSNFIISLEKAGVHSIVDCSYTDSEAISRKWKKKVGLLCINFLHEHEDTKEILRRWECHLAPNSRVVLYDCEKPGPVRIIMDYLGSLGDYIFEQRVGTLMVIMIDKCIHYWVIDANDIGLCRYCGRTRNFRRMRKEIDMADIRRRQTAKLKNKETRNGVKK